MKLNKAERFVLLAAALLIAAALGFRAGSGRSGAAFTIRTQREALASEVMRGGDETTDMVPVPAETAGNTEIGVVDINTAGVEQLTKLPGIGEVLAGRIIAYRETYGAFTHISDLLDVTGIGIKIYDNIKDHITV